MAAPRRVRRPGPVDPEGPEYIPEDVYPDDPVVEDGVPPDSEPVIVVEVDGEVPWDGTADEEEIYEEPYVEDVPIDPEPPNVE